MSEEVFKVGDTVFWDDPDDGLCSGDYTVGEVQDGEKGRQILHLSADDGSEVEAYAAECTHREWIDVQFPNWALCYFVNGDGSSLTDEEMKQVDAYVSSLRKEDYTIEHVTDDTNEFCANPAFGLACDTTRVRFYKVKTGVDFGSTSETVRVVIQDGMVVRSEVVEVKEVKA